MARNPLRMGRRKPFAWPRRPKPAPIEVAKPRLWEQAGGFVKQQPHLFLVSALFIFLFATDRINLITFISLGFFCLLFSDHMVDTGRSLYEKRQRRKDNAGTAVGIGTELRPKLGYYQRLAQKQRERSR